MASNNFSISSPRLQLCSFFRSLYYLIYLAIFKPSIHVESEEERFFPATNSQLDTKLFTVPPSDYRAYFVQFD